MAPFQIRPTRVASGYAINTQFPCDRGKPNRPQYGSFEDWVSALIQRALAEQDDRLHEVLIVGNLRRIFEGIFPGAVPDPQLPDR